MGKHARPFKKRNHDSPAPITQTSTNPRQIDDEDAAAAAAVAGATAFRFLCNRHGDPCLYCVCRKPYEEAGGMIECAKCKVGPHSRPHSAGSGRGIHRETPPLHIYRSGCTIAAPTWTRRSLPTRTGSSSATCTWGIRFISIFASSSDRSIHIHTHTQLQGRAPDEGQDHGQHAEGAAVRGARGAGAGRGPGARDL